MGANNCRLIKCDGRTTVLDNNQQLSFLDDPFSAVVKAPIETQRSRVQFQHYHKHKIVGIQSALAFAHTLTYYKITCSVGVIVKTGRFGRNRQKIFRPLLTDKFTQMYASWIKSATLWFGRSISTTETKGRCYNKQQQPRNLFSVSNRFMFNRGFDQSNVMRTYQIEPNHIITSDCFFMRRKTDKIYSRVILYGESM